MTEQEFLQRLEQLDQLHEEAKYQEQVEIIESLPEEVRGRYQVRCRLGRAFNNLHRFTDALEVLGSVREEGKEDSSWWSRMGYAFYHLERQKEAAEYFLRARELNPDNLDAKTFLAWMNIGADGRQNAWGGGDGKKDSARPATGNNGPGRDGQAPRRQKPAGRGNDWLGRGWDDMDEEG